MRGHTFRVRVTIGSLTAIGAIAVCAALVAATSVSAQSASGTVTGRVLWGSCIRAIPLPLSPDAQGQPAAADQPTAQAQPGPNVREPARPIPQPITGLPAGAVLVAVQNTSVSARTDEAGRFSLSGVPAGQYLTVAAGPVADSLSATAQRPNVFVNGGQSMDIGTLSLGGTPTIGAAVCRFPNTAVPQTGPADATPAPGAPTDEATPANP